MAILDSKGRLFGKFNILDIGALLVILLVISGIFFFPGTTGSVAQVGTTTKPIEVDLIVRGLKVKDIDRLSENGFKEKGKTNVIIRNQPYGQIPIKSIQVLPRDILVTQPDGTVKLVKDPRDNVYSTDMLLTLAGKATITDSGPVLGNSKVKIGMPFELEGFNYNFNASVIDVRIDGK
ncbi:DUF4330 domain-containing protein [Rivularia sp. UHCC 0363]|uniref:DUF4330 domain-containing protein n=1 Tax=Rivularia sp. UHCC 0363 TaxID=3110244 RepID=UPI002B1F6ADA|nr:DUF4330 domain-containing protein [Rivularia sp. UHCC 0363]MEA5597815.1 DUF4330 domain-containing protein [Rivularia sp. UHCC 0363]